MARRGGHNKGRKKITPEDAAKPQEASTNVSGLPKDLSGLTGLKGKIAREVREFLQKQREEDIIADRDPERDF